MQLQNTKNGYSLQAPIQINDQTSLQADTIRKKALEFEAVFVSQMLKQSGLSGVFTSDTGGLGDAMSGFFLEAIAEDLVAAGGFGLADHIAHQLKKQVGLEDNASEQG
jgi:Rod binding domain-containing protein